MQYQICICGSEPQLSRLNPKFEVFLTAKTHRPRETNHGHILRFINMFIEKLLSRTLLNSFLILKKTKNQWAFP